MKNGFRQLVRRMVAMAFLSGAPIASAHAQETWINSNDSRDVEWQIHDGDLVYASLLQDPLQPRDESPPETNSLDSSGGPNVRTSGMDLLRQLNNPAPGAGAVGGAERELLGTQDVGAMIGASSSLQTVGNQQRSLLAFDPHVRGLHLGQIYTQSDGEYWMPVRPDLDSMLARLNPSLVESVIVTPGPYGLRNGPGFAFIDVATSPTPRYEDCPESHLRLGLTSRFNGRQLYNHNTVFGGSRNYGYILSYANRNGNDYAAGDGDRIPSSYHAQNVLAQFGLDLSEDARVEFRYNRVDETDTEFALQMFDVSYLVSDSFSGSYISANPDAGTSFRMDGWYNRSNFAGDSRNVSKRGTPDNPNRYVIDRVETALDNFFGLPSGSMGFQGEVDGDMTNAGARAVQTFGDEGDRQFRTGIDFRYLNQNLAERFFLSGPGLPPELALIQTNQPRSYMVDPGAFAEFVLPWTCGQTITVGSRIDFVQTSAQRTGGIPEGWRGDDSSLTPDPANFPQNDLLHACYITDEIELTEVWKTRVGFGYAERVPTLTERYADGIFLGILQSGFSRVIGDPHLDKERNWQFDWSVEAEYEFVRARGSVFHAWIADYVTYQGNEVTDPSGARLLNNVNTSLATLAGFELYGETDVTSAVLVFASLQYVDGRDRQLNAPLPAIYPMMSRAGIRLHDPYEDQRWGVETGVMMADQQDRLGTIRVTGTLEPLIVETPTPGFTTCYLRGYYNVTRQFNVTAGVENLFDRTYYEHLNLRLPAANPSPGDVFPVSRVLSPGITPYLSVEWVF